MGNTLKLHLGSLLLELLFQLFSVFYGVGIVVEIGVEAASFFGLFFEVF